MKAITIHLPDSAYLRASSEAQKINIDVSGMCSLLLTEQLTSRFDTTEAPSKAPPRITIKPVQSARIETSSNFDVSVHFPDLPRTSITLAQGFVDAVLTYPRTKAFQNNRGVGFDPNFVFIEYLRLRGTPGLVASFYGRREDFQDPTNLLKNGRGESYSRADISNQDQLNAAIPLIKQSWELKFGR